MKKNLSEMRCLDLYLSHLSPREYHKIKDQIQPSTANISPLASWDLYSDFYHKKQNEAKKEVEFNHIDSLSKKYEWSNDLKSLLSKGNYDALVITDIHQKIIWVNEGFSLMTGYPKTFALHKTPSFLQGKNTSSQSKNRFRQKLQKNKPFKEIIINYKKNNTPYTCEVKIIPLHSDRTTHYLALEKEIG
jgi:PAS domain-containing protein